MNLSNPVSLFGPFMMKFVYRKPHKPQGITTSEETA